jgi:hypothetical protein
VGVLARDLREKDFGRSEDGLLAEFDDIAIGKFVAFFLK